jgi:bifunctional N-acetylglucosamine-1-phosphate-uridyltransferase/glucosamine-1-phosphate-acetyltransferase GlmU-like protein
MERVIVIMAGGLGKRMNSDIPKVLHKIYDIPMICRLLCTAYKTNPNAILIVVGKYRDIIEQTINQYVEPNISKLIKYINQPIAIGTGNAVLCALTDENFSAENNNTRVLILSGDTPFVSLKTMNDMFNSNKCLAMVTKYNDSDTESKTRFQDYGKVVSENNIITKIVEKKDCNGEELLIKQVNCGIYCYYTHVLLKCIPLIENKNSQNEYYLTDVVSLAHNFGILTYTFELEFEKQYEVIGVNTQEQLHELELLLDNVNI